jgi:dTDP-D-glucose 4,6-dehydratase
MILVTGGAGFIGANFVLDWLAHSDESVVNLDALTYAGNRESLSSLDGDARHVFVHGDICDRALLDRLFADHKPRSVVHFAAESHVDRSIHGPGAFVHTVCALLDEMKPDPDGSYARMITRVPDRPGNDRRYAIDARKIERDLGWRPAETFASGMRKTVRWYLDNAAWVARVQNGAYREWVSANYDQRRA